MSRVSRLHKTFVASLFLAILTLQAATAATNTVNVGPNFSFSPSSLKVKVGDTVVFNLVGGFHTVTGTGTEPFCGSGAISGTGCQVTFTKPGVFPYRCVFHSQAGNPPTGMVGSITVEQSVEVKPNVTPFQIQGWSDKIVASSLRGSHTKEAAYFDDQNIFVDWAVANLSSANITTTFFTELLLDGISVGSWSHLGLDPNGVSAVEDFDLGKLPAGPHTLKLVTDHTGVVDEASESDNSYEIPLFIQRKAHHEFTVLLSGNGNIFSPDTLTVHAGDTVTFSDLSGAHTVTGTGAEPFCGNTTLQPLNTCKVTLTNTGIFSYRCLFHSFAGNPPSGMVGSITVLPAEKANVAPFHPSGWTDSIVVSTTTGTHQSDLTLFDDQELFVDWAIANLSTTIGISDTFFTELRVDGVQKGSWSHVGLTPNTFNSVEDFSVGKLSAGTHTLQLITDHTAAVDESDETDNTYQITIHVIGRSGPSKHTVLVSNFEFTPASITVKTGDTVVFSNVSGSHTVTGTGSDPFCGNNAIVNSCEVTFKSPGVFPYRCLFHSSGGAAPAGMVGSVLVVSSVALESSSTVGGNFTPVGTAVVDFSNHSLTAPAPAGAAFWRLRSEVPLKITSIEIKNGNVVLIFQ